MYDQDPPFLRSIIIGDESWCYQYYLVKYYLRNNNNYNRVQGIPDGPKILPSEVQG